MKRIITILITITLLLSLTACNKDNGNYPKDDGRRYANVVDAHYGEENCTRSEVIYEIEIDGIVCSAITTSRGSESSMVYKDREGYIATNGNFSGGSTLIIQGEILQIILANNSHVVFISSLQQEQQYIPKITDNLNSPFEYGEGFVGTAYRYGYMTVLDEIPEDYAIIIDGVSYKISDYMSNEAKANIIFTIFFTGIAIIVVLLIKKGIQKKKRQNLIKKIF